MVTCICSYINSEYPTICLIQHSADWLIVTATVSNLFAQPRDSHNSAVKRQQARTCVNVYFVGFSGPFYRLHTPSFNQFRYKLWYTELHFTIRDRCLNYSRPVLLSSASSFFGWETMPPTLFTKRLAHICGLY